MQIETRIFIIVLIRSHVFFWESTCTYTYECTASSVQGRVQALDEYTVYTKSRLYHTSVKL